MTLYRSAQLPQLLMSGGGLVINPRRLLLNLVGLSVCLACLGLNLMVGELTLSPAELLLAWAGRAEAGTQFLFSEIRLPRALGAALVGAGLAASGLLLQTLARNRLAGPDVMGLGEGAVLAMSLSLMSSELGQLGPWWLALLGALVLLGLVLLCAGGVGRQGQRVMVVGLALASLAGALFDVVLAAVPVLHSQAIYSFSVGSLLATSYEVLRPVSWAMGVLLLLLLPLLPGLRLLQLGEDAAQLLGLRLGPQRGALLLIAAALAGLGLAVSGPLAFVALAAPLLARRLLGPLPLVAAMALGASLVLLADLLGRCLLAPVELPAGVLTGLLGGPFLLWLVWTQRDDEEGS